MRISDWSSDVCSSDLVAIGEMLSEAANAALLSWSIAMEDGVVALLRYTLDMRADGRIPDSDALDARLEKMVRGWVPAVEAALVRHIEPARAARLALRPAATFPPPYPSMNDTQEAAWGRREQTQ